MKKMTRKTMATVAGAGVAALFLAACGGGASGDAGGASGDGDGPPPPPETLSVAFWAGISQESLDAFEEEYGIRVVVNNFQNTAAALESIRNGLTAGGAGLSDVHFMDNDMFATLMTVPEDWADLPEVPGRWIDWKVEQGTVDGVIKGYGTDIGPVAIAFNADMLEAAGLPSDPEGFSEFIGGENATWETFLDAGRTFHEASGGVAWTNTFTDLFQAAVQQMPAPFENPETGNPWNLADNTDLHDLFMTLAPGIADGLSAGINLMSEEAPAAFQNEAFATVIAPSWRVGMISERAAGLDGWRIAYPAFPLGGGNWGGSFTAVPATGDNIYWATRLADWLTSPEHSVLQFLEQGHFPSQHEALADPVIADAPNEFFGGQIVGRIYTELAEATPVEKVTGFRGENFMGIRLLVQDALVRVEDGFQTPQEAWDAAVAEFEGLGLTTD